MGWLDGIFGWGSNESDPLRKLDPKLREFLEKESPVKYRAGSQDDAAARPAPAATAATPVAPSVAGAQTQGAEPADALPSESLYQDGRYAHLWKTYKPLAAVEAETKSDHEKLMDVLDGFKERKAQIGRAALENCALEQLDWNTCMKAGSWTSRMTMCSTEVKKFERCYMMQSRLLKALGYLSAYDRPAQVDEDIQMHADKLYHRMLEQEAAIEVAKKEGREIPKLEPVFTAPASARDAEMPPLSEDARRKWKEALEKLPEEDRAAEEEAMKAELRAKAQMVSQIQGLWQEQAEERKARKEHGKETVTDKISSFVSRK